MKPSKKLLVAMVGKPARGKTHIARKITRYLNWRGHETKLFNVGNYRRRHLGAAQPARFFDPSNDEGVDARRRMAIAALDDLKRWLATKGDVAIYDATNSTRHRRHLLQTFASENELQLIFIESICDDPNIVEANILETKVSSPDYKGVASVTAVEDFRKRIQFYTNAYEPLQDAEGSWVKIIDVGRQVITNEITGYIPSRLVFFLMNLHIQPPTIWMTRHGQSQFNQSGRIGGDSPLSEAGEQFALDLNKYVSQHLPDTISVWTSTLQRTIATARHLPFHRRALKELDEINAGICDGLTYRQIEDSHPSEFAARQLDKYRYRYPQGESYRDIIRRLDPIIIDIERNRSPLLIVAHQAILRALYAYLMEKPPEDCPHLPIPLHTLIQLQPKTYGCSESRVTFSSPSGDSASS